MGGLFAQIALTLGGGLLPPRGQLRRMAIGGAVIAVMLLTAYCFLMLALWILAARAYGGAVASAIMAGGTLLAAACAWAFVALLNARGRRRARRARQMRSLALERTMTEAAILSSLPATIRRKPLLMLVLAAGVGYAVTRAGQHLGGRRE